MPTFACSCVFLSVGRQNGAFWLCRLVAVWRVLFESLSFLFVFFAICLLSIPPFKGGNFLAAPTFVCSCVPVGRSSKRCILALQARCRVRVLFESLSFLFVFLQSVFCQSPRLRTATFLCNDVSVCLCCSMGKCLNYPQTVLSEAIGCVYGIFLSWFFTVPLRVFSVAVFFFTPTLWITPTPQKSLLSATF